MRRKKVEALIEAALASPAPGDMRAVITHLPDGGCRVRVDEYRASRVSQNTRYGWYGVVTHSCPTWTPRDALKYGKRVAKERREKNALDAEGRRLTVAL